MSVRELERRLEGLEQQLLHANGEWAESLEQQIDITRQDLEAARLDEAIEDVRADLYDHPSNPAEEEQWWD